MTDTLLRIDAKALLEKKKKKKNSLEKFNQKDLTKGLHRMGTWPLKTLIV